MSKSIQSNVKQGVLPFNSAADFTDKEGYLVKLTDGGSIAELALPADVADLTLYVIDHGGDEDEDSHVIPLAQGDQVRLVAKGTGSAGGVLALAALSGSDHGKVRALPATADDYFSPGIAEEDFVDGQHVKVRVFPRVITVS
jgi:hypothetical protein